MKDAVAYIIIFVLIVTFASSKPLDMAPLYNGAQAVIRGENPYSDAVTLQNQLDFYGRTAESHEDQHRMSYPLTTALIYVPLTALPITTAAFTYRVLAALFLVLALVRYGASPLWSLGVLVLSREPITAFVLGQTAMLTSALVVLGLDALQRHQHYRAAVFLALSTLHPILTFPLALLVLLPYRRALVTFIIIMLAWLGVSIGVGGFWILDWITTLTAYSTYVSYMVWLPRLLLPCIPIGLLVLYLAYRQRELLTSYALALSAIILLFPITGLYQLTLFSPVLVRMPRRRVLVLGAAVWALSALAPFELRQYTPLLFVSVSCMLWVNQNDINIYASMRKGLKSVLTS